MSHYYSSGSEQGASGQSPSAREGPSLCVRDIMTTDVSVCNPETDLNYVARMMQDRDCGGIPVVQDADTMRPIGFVTDRDIVIRALARNQDVLSLCAGDVMSVDVLTVHPEMSLDQCVKAMEQRQVRRAVVVDRNGKCCGILSQADIARKGASEQETAELVREISFPDPGSADRHYH